MHLNTYTVCCIGNGDYLSNSHAEPGKAITLAAAYFPFNLRGTSYLHPYKVCRNEKIAHLLKFSRKSLTPPMASMRKAQFMTPSKCWNPEPHDRYESLARCTLMGSKEVNTVLIEQLTKS